MQRSGGRAAEPVTGVEALSTPALVGKAARTVALLLQTEVDLTRAEVTHDLRSGRRALAGLAAAAVLAGFTLLLVALVLALATYFPGWLAAIIVAGLVLAAGAVTGLFAWKRIRPPLARTRETLKEHLRWVKDRLA